jgi:S1-C subfamily serine protease
MTDHVEPPGATSAPEPDDAADAPRDIAAAPIEASGHPTVESPATESVDEAVEPSSAGDSTEDVAAAPPPPPPAQPGWPFPVMAPAAPSHETPPFGSPTTAGFPPPPQAPIATTEPKEKKGRRWVAVAVIAAVVGALVGSGVTALVDHNNNSGESVTIHESNSAPGAAVLSGNVTIPQLVKDVIPAVVSIDVKAGGNEDEGTGMIITSNGEVITNNHVIELFTGTAGGSITVTEYGQTKALPTTLVGYDAAKDVALLKINNVSNLKTVTFGSSAKTQVGDAVVAIGNALGLAAGTPTVTQGIVSALGRSVTAGGTGTASENLQNLIQTDAAINSGGPLIDTADQVIGMNTAVAGTSSDGTGAQNIGFAIPISQVESLIPELEKGGPAVNTGGYLGVDITTLTPALRQQYGLTPTSGAVILNVVSGSPADQAGLKQGDVIVDVGGTAIDSSETLQSLIQKDKPGQVVPLTYYVGNEKHTVSVTLGTQAQAQQQATQQSGSANPFGSGGFPGDGGSTGGGTQIVP